MAGPSDGRVSVRTSDYARIVRPLSEAATRSDASKRIGRKAMAHASLRAAGVAIPDSWVVDSTHFDAIAAAVLPQKHDLRSLAKLAGTPEGEEHCARAVEELLAATLPEDLVAAVEAWWHAFAVRPSAGIAVRPSLVATGERATDAARYLHTELVCDRSADVLAAIRRVWASAAASLAVGRYAECGVRDLSVAILLQPVVSYDHLLWLTRMTGRHRADSGAPWQLGVELSVAGDTGRSALVLAPVALGRGGDVPEALRPLHAALTPRGFELLQNLSAAAERVLGADALVAVAFTAHPEPMLTVLQADDSPRWRTRDGDGDSAWLEVLCGRVERWPRAPLSQGVLSRAAERATLAGLHALGASTEEPRQFVWSSGGRTYLGLHSLAAAVRDLPALTASDVLAATGTASAELLDQLVHRSGSAPRRLRQVVQGAALLSRQARLHRELGDMERELQRSARALGEMDLTLLPTDGIATTLSSIDELLGRTVELWSGVAASQLCHQVALRALLRRAGHEASEATAAIALSGAGATLGASLTVAFARVVDVFRADEPALASLAGSPRSLDDFADGAARGALGQFLSSYGDVARSPFDLERPRWSEDPREIFVMIRAWLEFDGAARTRVETAQERVRARADAEIARHEPDLGWAERNALRSLVERSRRTARARATLDRLAYRVLALFRAVVGDADRRLRRIDSAFPPGGAFACSFARIVASFRTGRPELRHVVAMHEIERHLEASEPGPPLSFVGFPPRIAAPFSSDVQVRGIGVSSGVVDGNVCIDGELRASERAGAETVLVTSALDVAMLPRYFAVGAVICESGGMLSPAAEALRELGVPAVLGVEGATASLSRGDRVRVDGERGLVHRLDRPARA